MGIPVSSLSLSPLGVVFVNLSTPLQEMWVTLLCPGLQDPPLDACPGVTICTTVDVHTVDAALTEVCQLGCLL